MKPQQQTLSMRISDAMRQRLENARRLLASATEEPVSLSNVAKYFLEAAHGDTVEASELLSRPTETLLNIRRKWERQQDLSHSEWMVLGYYLQVGCEQISEDLQLPTGESFASLLEALITAHSLSVGETSEVKYDYLDRLRLNISRSDQHTQVETGAACKAARVLIQKLRESPASTSKPTFAGRELYLIIRGGRAKGIHALNEALAPSMPALFRIAARGHYLREGRPVREERRYDLSALRQQQPPPVVFGDLRLSISLTDNNESSILLD